MVNEGASEQDAKKAGIQTKFEKAFGGERKPLPKFSTKISKSKLSGDLVVTIYLNGKYVRKVLGD